jgi:hypothetical protein
MRHPKAPQNGQVLDPSWTLISGAGIGCPALSSLSIPAISHFWKSSRQDPTATVIARSRRYSGFPTTGSLPPLINTSAFIATNPEALLPHSIASTPPLGANLLTPNSLRRGAGLGGPELGSLDCEHVFDRLLPTVERKIKEATVPLGWKKGHHHSMVDRRSRFLESTTLF